MRDVLKALAGLAGLALMVVVLGALLGLGLWAADAVRGLLP